MRLLENESVKSEMSFSEWQELTKSFYSKEKQNERINNLVNYIVEYCQSVKQNKTAKFSGVWDFLDVRGGYNIVFKARLKKKLRMELFAKTKVDYNVEEQDIIVRWE